MTTSHCSNNYGPYQHSEKFIPTIIRSCLEGTPIPIYGDGSPIRDWLYVEDHIDAIELILQKGKLGETYNIGGQNEIQNLEMANMICSLLDELKPAQKRYGELISFVQDRQGHDWRYSIDNSKIQIELGFKPKFTIATGLIQTLKFILP